MTEIGGEQGGGVWQHDQPHPHRQELSRIHRPEPAQRALNGSRTEWEVGANFARRLLETNPTIENHAKTARQILQAAEKNMTDATQLNCDFRNPFVACGATYVPIYRGQKDVSCPYCSSRFVTDQEGKLCTVCDLSVVGSDASGLLCSPTQIK